MLPSGPSRRPRVLGQRRADDTLRLAGAVRYAGRHRRVRCLEDASHPRHGRIPARRLRRSVADDRAVGHGDAGQRHHVSVDARPGLRPTACAFVQFYFGLPLAMVVLSVAFVPRFYGLRVFTAYEYLEGRFDPKTRQLAALLFLIQRGLSAGITIYAPAIVLSTVLGWSLNLTCVAIGALVILYTVLGGTRAVSQTQKHQMVVMLGGMAVAFVVVVTRLPPELSFGRAVASRGHAGQDEHRRLLAPPRQSLHLLVGHGRRLLPGHVVLRHRSVAGAAVPVGALHHRKPLGPAVQRAVQDSDAVPDPPGRGVRLSCINSNGLRCFSTR